ncbi:MAG: hypothetical protein DDT26_00311 [Dehalococcoidia bacterium]|nr:hypothetical protein [Chloroflexota bacterium]
MSVEQKVWISKVEEDEGDLVVSFEPGLLAALGWKAGDVILWAEPSPNGTVMLKKVSKQ